MILLEISDIKAAMAHLLVRNSFDDFYMDRAEVTALVRMSLHGRRNTAWYNSDELSERNDLSEWVRWSEVKPVIFSYIRGDRTPTVMKVVLKADAAWAESLLAKRSPDSLSGQQRPELILNFRYEKGGLSVVTGVSYAEFTMDKQLEFAWDEAVEYYFRQLGIALF